MDLRDRIALVTGAGHRVGRAIALGLAGRGATVAVHYHRTREGADEVAREIERLGARARTFAADLADARAPAELIRRVDEAMGGIDILVNSAAVMERTPFGEVTPERWDEIMALNLRAPFLLAQAAAPLLTARGGAVVNIADLAAFETWPAYLPHGISKAGIVYLTRALARVLAPAVRVNGVAPGAVLLPEHWEPRDAEHLVRTTPLARLGSPDDVVRTVLFLLESDYLTGETIIVDGGRHIRC